MIFVSDVMTNSGYIVPKNRVLTTIDLRHQEKFRYYESGYPFEYYMVRVLSREKRELDLTK
jgi:hypothetical protein